MPVSRQRLKGLYRRLLNPAWVCFAWFGMTAGISLLEAPVKFTAPALSRAAALDVGRVVFAALNRVELVALILLLVLVRASGSARRLWVGCLLLALIMIAQSAWLLPELAERAREIVAGVEPGPSPVHGLYAALELAKLLILLYLGLRAMPADPGQRPAG